MLYKLNTPLSLKDIAPLRCGDEVLLSGTIITARDKAHEYLVRRAMNVACALDTQRATSVRRAIHDTCAAGARRNMSTLYAAGVRRAAGKNRINPLPFDLDGACLYHCGPLVAMKNNARNTVANKTSACSSIRWTDSLSRMEHFTAKILAAGPTTSARMEAYTTEIIRQYGVRMIIGKGGMDERTRKALKNRAVYCSAVGGASQVLARAVTGVENVYGLAEFGETDAFWILHVKNFPTIVTMDANGGSLHENVKKASVRRLKEFSHCK